jgi:hypothetical protein
LRERVRAIDAAGIFGDRHAKAAHVFLRVADAEGERQPGNGAATEARSLPAMAFAL